ncbi:MAG: GHKL domain-containing protein [Lachnospiraceae bacterium]|nr:GHKL domain-containing protein [Lachnospiraceae bacterium]
MEKSNKNITISGICLMAACILCFILYMNRLSMTGTTFMQKSVVCLTGVGTMRILNLLKLPLTDYISLFFATFVLSSFPYSNFSIFFLFLFVFGISAWRRQLQNGKVLFTWLAYILFLLNQLFLEFIYDIFRDSYYQFTNTLNHASFWKIVLFCLLSLTILGIDFCVIYLIRHFGSQALANISRFEIFYPQIAQNFVFGSVCIFLIGFYFNYRIVMLMVFDDLAVSVEIYPIIYEKIESLQNALLVVIILIQMFILITLLTFSKYRYSMDAKRRAEENLLLYSNDLEKNLAEVRNLKHDMKNILFTLSHLIERSQDADLKRYFQETVNPYFQKELKKNDLYASLQPIRDEQLKAFLYYKLTSGNQESPDIRFSLEGEEFTTFPFSDEMDFLDLIRVLGIFIDNAIEESMHTKEQQVEVIISNQKEICEIQVRNSIREKKEVIAGISDKGIGRGNGLLIVHDILKNYPDMILNSYTNHHQFVQSLMIQKNR